MSCVLNGVALRGHLQAGPSEAAAHSSHSSKSSPGSVCFSQERGESEGQQGRTQELLGGKSGTKAAGGK